MPQNNLPINMPVNEPGSTAGMPITGEPSITPEIGEPSITPEIGEPSITPEMPSMMPLPSMSPEQMRQNLDQMYEKVKTKERGVNSRKLMDKNTLNELKIQLIQQFFEFMQNQGVDPNDPGSINKFMGQLQSQDPDLFALFEMAFNGLIQEESMLQKEPLEPEVEAAEAEINLAPNFKNIQEQMLRYQK